MTKEYDELVERVAWKLIVLSERNTIDFRREVRDILSDPSIGVIAEDQTVLNSQERAGFVRLAEKGE